MELFPRQWISKIMQGGLTKEALVLEEILKSGDCKRAWELIREYKETDYAYYLRQASRIAHITTRNHSAPLRLYFDGFWKDFIASRSPLFLIFELAYQGLGKLAIVQSPETADIAIYSCFSGNLPSKETSHCTRFLFLGENVKPFFGPYDYSLSSHYRRFCRRNMYFPIWLYELLISFESLISEEYQGLSTKKLSSLIVEKYFDNYSGSAQSWVKRSNSPIFIGSNYEPHRLELINCLEDFAISVEVFGTGYRPVKNKMGCLGMYKINICPENSISAGYITEKLLHGIGAGCKTIYWGGLPISAVKALRSAGHIILDEDSSIKSHLRILRDKEYILKPPDQNKGGVYLKKAVRITISRLARDLRSILRIYTRTY